MTYLLVMYACDIFCDELILLHMLFQSTVITLLLQGRIQDFLRRGSEQRGVSLKQDVWGYSPPEAIYA